MKNKIIYTLIYLIIVISCTSKESTDTTQGSITNNSKIEIINPLEKSSLTEDEFVNLVSDLKYIPLKGDSNSLIAEMTKVIEHENFFYVLDRKYAAIRIFDKKGEFKKNISNVGSGPGQYISLNGFEIDEEKNEIIIYSLESMKLIHYTLDGVFLNEKKISFFGSEFVINTKLKNYAYFLNNNPSLEKQNYNLVYTDYENKTNNNFFAFSKESGYSMDFSGGITKGESGIVYNTPLNDTIYNCNESCEAKYVIDFGSLKCPEDVKKNMMKIPELMKYSYVESKIYESKQALIFPFSYQRYSYTAYYDKKNKKLISNRDTPNLSFFIMRPPVGLNTKTNTFFSYISKDFVDMAKNRDSKILEKLRKKNREFVSLLEKLKDEDNPILISYSFK
jgi:hypothetical protein